MVFGQCLRVRALILDSLKMTFFYPLSLMLANPLSMSTLYLLAGAAGVPEEPKKGISETSSKFFGRPYKTPFLMKKSK